MATSNKAKGADVAASRRNEPAANAKSALSKGADVAASRRSEPAANAKSALSKGADVAASRRSESAANAKSALSNFTLSKQSTRPMTRKFLSNTRSVASQQREAINQQLEGLPTSSGPGMTIVTAADRASNLVQTGTMDLATLLSAMDKAKTGTQFYTSGTALAEKIEIRSAIDAFFTKLKGGSNG